MSVVELLIGWTDMEAALPAYLEAESYASGRIDEVFADEKIRRELAKTGESYRFNLIKTAIGTRADRCEIDMIKVPDNEAATDRLGEIWDANDMAIHYPAVITGTFTYGDYYVMVWPIMELVTPDETQDAALVQTGVEITTHDPKNTRMIYDPENERRKWFLIRRWSVPAGPNEVRWRVDLLFADRIERWISRPGQTLTDPNGWELTADDPDSGELSVEVNPFEEVPAFHHRTDLPYGTPVHEAGYGAQNALNKMLITQLTTTDSHGFPQRYQLIDKDADLDSNNDDTAWVDDNDAPIYSPVGSVQRQDVGTMRSGPGTIQRFTGTSAVGQFEASQPSVFLDPAQFYIRLMAQLTTTPLHYFDPSGDVPSGESLKVADAPLVKSIERLQLLQLNPLREEWLFAMKLAGMVVDMVEIRWAPVQSAVGLEDWTAAKAKQDAGVPVDQTLMEAGYRPEQVARWLDEQAEANTLSARVALLASIGTAIQSIGAGIALGVVSEQDAAMAVSIVLNQVNASGRGADPS